LDKDIPVVTDIMVVAQVIQTQGHQAVEVQLMQAELVAEVVVVVEVDFQMV
jgi:hypothetical protein